MFTPKTPHFFKIILDANIRDKKLEIPGKFVRKYGNGLSNSVLLTVPSGDTWHVELTKSDGIVWLQNGWQEFSEYFSLKYGHLLVFKYEGNGKFLVLIFDTSASEIDYPCKSHIEDQKSDDQMCLKPVKEEPKDDVCDKPLYGTPSCKETKRKKSRSLCSNTEYLCKSYIEDHKSDDQLCLKPVKEEAKDGVYDETLYETPPCKKARRNKSQSQCSKIEYPCKSHIEDHKSEDQVSLKPVKEEAKDDFCDKTLYETPPCKETRKKKPQSQCSKPRKKLKTAQKDKNRKDCEDASTDEEGLQTKVPRDGRAFGAIEYDKALQRAFSFESENPFFLVTMQPSYINPGRKMCIPKNFTMKFLTRDLGDLTLCTSDGRTWSAQYLRYMTRNKYTKATIHIGWRQFMLDNNLEAGDVCVFELISQTEIMLKVIIYRVRQDASCSSPLGGINSLENGDNVSSSTPGSTESKHHCSIRPLTPHEKARAIQKASNFKSKNPFFKVVMQPRYLTIRCSLSIPYKFVNQYLDEEKEEAILRVSDGRTWVVKFAVKVVTGGQHKAEFSHTWRAFARDNNLEVGDVCVFELINRNENSFKVSIFSAAPGANSSVSPQAHDVKASQVASKNCSVPKIEADDDFGNCYTGNPGPAAQPTTIVHQENEEEVNPTDDAIASQVVSKDFLVPKVEVDDFGKCYAGNFSPAAQITTTGYQEAEEEVKPSNYIYKTKGPINQVYQGYKWLEDLC
ncbi:hypothetical protein CXB51_031176 [Gossypium anomalum]|uniref:TF-B3 domain-containing protein n=1 Tax=Gossypium anomalum TaxID=47600 RepID=A0A8J5Y1W7_9ROSI|nr:hypothetical protein CXB51_031176 [Gossypium anomalum]